MAKQQGLPKTAEKVNLKAIQNLNSYVDGTISLAKGGVYPFSSYPTGIMEIEFVMSFSNTGTKAANPTTSRRRVELQVPPPTMQASSVFPHVQRQVVKLLRMADLPYHSVDIQEEDPTDMDEGPGEISESWMVDQVAYKGRQKTRWERSRERFLSRLNWDKFDAMYEEALRDAQAHLMTKNLIRQVIQLPFRNSFTDEVTPLERLVAYRRLLRLLDENFDELHLEDCGKYWEELTLIVTEARPYNTSSSAMRKRRQRNLETGYSFTIHHDNNATVRIPVDFQNDELIQELQRNVGDFYEWTLQDSGIESIFDSA
eukprot:scaffold22589_cov138-Cylindrotheca_fusiformis.AAC.33